MNPLMSSIERGLTAAKAVDYTLNRIKADPVLGWRMGFGTEVFAKLTQALAEATGTPVETVREQFAPRGLKEPILFEWKDATKELPDADIVVLVYRPEGDEPVWIGAFDGNEWGNPYCGIIDMGRVTHWAPFPKPPEAA